MPLELRPETEAYRLCQPMHVLSFGAHVDAVSYPILQEITLMSHPMELTRRTEPAHGMSGTNELLHIINRLTSLMTAPERKSWLLISYIGAAPIDTPVPQGYTEYQDKP
jgi:hypothetical protein